MGVVCFFGGRASGNNRNRRVELIHKVVDISKRPNTMMVWKRKFRYRRGVHVSLEGG